MHEYKKISAQHVEGTPGESPKLAWVNSICLLFLVSGIIGAASPRSPISSPVPLEPVAMVVGLMAESTLPTHAPDVSATKDSPTARTVSTLQPEGWFAAQVDRRVPPVLPVPVLGPLQARIPFIDPSPGSGSAGGSRPDSPELIGPTGREGTRPSPPYPASALSQRQQGAVTLLLLANDGGGLSDVQVFSSSGHLILDRSARNYIRRHWTVPPGRSGRQFQVTIDYELRDPRPTGSRD
jgi:TonB family protein